MIRRLFRPALDIANRSANAPAGRRGLFGSFSRNRRGTTAIEFAIIAGPFLVLMFGIIEFGLAFFVNRILDHAVMESTRLIRTGQAQKANFDKAAFKAEVCTHLTDFLCDNARFDVDVRTFSTFSSIGTLPDLVDADGNFSNNLAYVNSKAGDIVVARVIYRWPMFTSLLQTDPADTGNMERLLVSTAVFRNEPFPW
ncbi:TadE/TadG family type IV pilus assembly protein [Polymorphum gilvum]|uniref:TadE-like protein n=1 Tax=Polymorphum gilvum (strain LMG 25793 / CGMCC 1.9160 / SL003B-26A1) TaxID=991905 RepID=F2J2R5_POLGS|nr:TadE/TadG family type IV pilus assembly protein [Polymorphum gilvum]ADZ72089.1 TadE-like protein [Polymorphum gilvum SL003B-26A1]